MSELYQRSSASASSYSGGSGSSNNSSPTGGASNSSIKSYRSNGSQHAWSVGSHNSHNGGIGTTMMSKTTTTLAIPGRPQRRRRRRPLRHHQRAMSSLLLPYDILVAILLWYALGVLSIASSKILLSSSSNDSSSWAVLPIHPLTLTLQQLSIGTMVLYGMIALNFGKVMMSGGKTVDTGGGGGGINSNNGHHHHAHSRVVTATPSSPFVVIPPTIGRELTICAICFTVGFFTTNLAFFRAAPSYVETVKAGEPLTSAILAVLYKIEILTSSQAMYLATIVVGVLLSTVAQQQQPGSNHDDTTTASSSSHQAAWTSCAIVMISNLCFSYRGLYQKLLRRKLLLQPPTDNNNTLDDLNLQYQMQCTGAAILFLPALLLQGIVPYMMRGGADLSWWNISLQHPMVMVRYVVLACFNGLCFTWYNLASTYILTRLSVVHHAALNCLRRVFAIVVTSILFQVPMSLQSASGIALAIVGFLAYTQSKQQQQLQLQQHQQLLSQQQQHPQQPSSMFENGNNSNIAVTPLLP